jgi:hypothetical protein
MAIGLGAKGDGVTDDTAAINTFLQKVGVAVELLIATEYSTSIVFWLRHFM